MRGLVSGRSARVRTSTAGWSAASFQNGPGPFGVFSDPWYHQAEVSTSSCLARVTAT